MSHSRYEILAFCLGAVVASLASYFILTRERRLISRIRRGVEMLADLHDLPPTFRRFHISGCGDDIVTDREILSTYLWAVKYRANHNLQPERLSAEVIICEKMLGLTRIDAVRALTQAKTLEDLRALAKR